jgi:hypothetical protein
MEGLQDRVVHVEVLIIGLPLQVGEVDQLVVLPQVEVQAPLVEAQALLAEVLAVVGHHQEEVINCYEGNMLLISMLPS